MILRPTDTGLLLVTQPDHAAAAADLIGHFTIDDFARRPTRDAVLLATREHDVGWADEDAAPTIEPQSGRPHDFVNAPIAVRQRLWPRAVAHLRRTSTYVAALVAQHALTVYGRYANDPAWASFFTEMADRRDREFDAAEAPGFAPTPLDPANPVRQAFLQDYGYLSVGDMLSLVFCNAWTDVFDADRFRIRLVDATIVISPDPFGGRTVPFRVRARRLADRRYHSDDELRQALAAAPDEWLPGIARGTDGVI